MLRHGDDDLLLLMIYIGLLKLCLVMSFAGSNQTVADCLEEVSLSVEDMVRWTDMAFPVFVLDLGMDRLTLDVNEQVNPLSTLPVKVVVDCQFLMPAHL